MQNPKNELRRYLNQLIRRLLYIKGLSYQLKLLKEWETPKREIALEKGAYFFKLVSYSFNRTMLIELCMLLDDRERKDVVDWLSKARRFAKSLEPKLYNIDTGKYEIVKTTLYQNSLSKHQKLLDSKKRLINRVKARRDKALAHTDAKYFNKPEDLYVRFPLSIKDIDDLIETLTKILKAHYNYLIGGDLDIKVYATTNVDTILVNTRAFNRVWFDNRAVTLFPYLYKLDDFEEKLKEHLANKSSS
jgi:hypothetical protein